MTVIQIVLTGGTALFCLLLTVCVRPARSSSFAVTAALIFLVMVPPDVTAVNRTVVTLFVPALLMLGALRSKLPLMLPPLSSLAFIVYIAVSTVLRASQFNSVASAGLQLLMLGTVLWVCSATPESPLRAVVRALPVIVPAQFVLSLNEILGQDAIWPRRDGVTHRIEGVNNLLPLLDARAMGTTSYAITLGVLMAICAILALWAAVEQKRAAWLMVFLLAAATVGLSGTRTGALMVIVGILVLVVARWRSGSVAPLLLLAPPALLVANRERVTELVGFGGEFAETRSFEHRMGIWDNADALLSQPTMELLFGVGAGRASEMVQRGLLGGVVEVGTFDNDYVRILAAFGLIGIVLLAATLIMAFLRGNPGIKAATAAMAFALATYDVTGWYMLFAFIIIFSATGFHESSRRRAGGDMRERSGEIGTHVAADRVPAYA